jgi:hypothetical protein
VLVAALVIGASAGVAPAAATPTDLYVNNGLTPNTCSDTGPATQAEPLCTIQAAANIAQPGQTVHVGGNSGGGSEYQGEVDITRSGNQGAPISFVADPGPHSAMVVNSGGLHAFVVTSAHDVTISGFTSNTTGSAVVITDSSRITLDRGTFSGGNQGAQAGVDVTGASTGVVVSRTSVGGFGPSGISFGPGTSGATVTTDESGGNGGAGIAIDGSQGATITSDTTTDNCASGIALRDGSAGATIENDVALADVTRGYVSSPCADPANAELSVSADSVVGTSADYNSPYNGAYRENLYDWAGTVYPTSAAFLSGTGQGAHDTDTDSEILEGSPVIDSADADAPGELSTDALGLPTVDDPLVANTGTGAGTRDRGAHEFQNPFHLNPNATVSPVQGPAPLPVTVTGDVTNPWSTPVTYRFDFDDGSAPVTTSTPTAQHTYTSPDPSVAPDNPNLTAVLPDGSTQRAGANLVVTTPGPFVATMTVTQINATDPGEVSVDASASTDPWLIEDHTLDWGDGTTPTSSNGFANHEYTAPGRYLVTLTEHDNDGRTATAVRNVTIGSSYVPMPPVRVLDTRNGTGVGKAKLGPNGTLTLHLTGTQGVPTTGVSAVVLNLTVTNATAGGYLSATPAGQPIGSASAVNFVAGQTVPNLVTVPVGAGGAITIENHNAAGTVDVVADLDGYYLFGLDQLRSQYQGFLVPVTPKRLLDTRNGTGAPKAALGPNSSLALQINGPGGSVNGATAVVLNVTITHSTAGGYLSVRPDGTPLPTATNLNFTAGETVSNAVIVQVPNGGKIDFYNLAGTVDVIADIEGYYTSSGASFLPLTPTRVLDTRNGTGVPTGKIGPNAQAVLTAAGAGGIPTDAQAVTLNVTATNSTTGGYITVHADGTPLPATSTVNFAPSQTVPIQVITQLGTNGKIDFHNLAGTVDVIADVSGYFGLG